MLTLPVTMPVPPVRKNGPVGATTENPSSATKYVMASPRAFSIGAPIEGTDEGTMTRAAKPFPRLDGEIEVPVGTRAIFSLSPERETAWQNATCRAMKTTQTVQGFEVAVTPYDCDRCTAEGLSDEPVAARNGKPGKGGSEEVVPYPWITIAADGLWDTRNGPSLGHAKAGVPVTFRQPGTCCVRGIASPSVCVWNPGPLEPSQDRSTQGQEAPAEQPVAPPALDTDVVDVTVHVTDRPNPGTRPQQCGTKDPDATHRIPMPSIGNTKTLHADKDNPKGSGAAKGFTPEPFLGHRLWAWRSRSKRNIGN